MTSSNRSLKLPQHMLSARYLESSGLFDVERLHHAIVDDHGVTLAAFAHAEFAAVHGEAHGAGEFAIAVRQHAHLAAGALILAPGAHHECVIDRDADDFIDAFLLQRRLVLHKTGHMLGRTGGGEGARSEEHTSELQL